MKKIILTQGVSTIVDDDLYHELRRYSWYANKGGGHKIYAVAKYMGEQIKMHRVIMDAPSELMVDHINGDTLDNRKCNLRLCTNSQNQMNKGPQSNNTSGYKGVCLSGRKKPYLSQIRLNGKLKHLGYFMCKHEAARAYNLAARMYHGEFAYTNDIIQQSTINKS